MRVSTALGWYLFSIISLSPFGGVESPLRVDCQRCAGFGVFPSEPSEFQLVLYSPTSPERPDYKTPTRSIVLLAVAGFASQAQVRVMDSLLPQIASDFHTTIGSAAVVVTAYAVAHGSVQLVIGPVGDKLGKYRTVAMMCAIACVLVTLCGLAASLHQLMLARFATGL